MDLIRKFIKWRQNKINLSNRKRLTNFAPTIICSNCTGGVIYHWLGLEFRSPFINLFMDNRDFIVAMNHFDEFISTELIEDLDSNFPYPVGIGAYGVKVHFMHYPDFHSALLKWNERCKRIDKNNMTIWLTNLGTGIANDDESGVIEDFLQIKFPNKLIFVGESKHGDCDYNSKDVVVLKGFNNSLNKNIFFTQSIFGKRYIDQFDYVDYLNKLKNPDAQN